MDPVSTFTLVYNAVNALYTAVCRVKVNQQQCLYLYNRVAALIPLLQPLSDSQLGARSGELKALLGGIKEIIAFVKKQKSRAVLHKLIKGQDDQQKFAEYHATLTQLNQTLSLALSIESHFDQQHAILAAQQDAQYVQQHMQELTSQLKELDRKAKERHASAKSHIVEVVNGAVEEVKKHLQENYHTTAQSSPHSHTFRRIPWIDLTMEAKPIGSGSFGDVYRGVWTTMHKTVAIKVLKARLTEETKAEFLREAQLMHDIRGYEHVVTFLGACIDNSEHCLVMEYVGNSLFSLIHGGAGQSLSWPARCDLAYQIVNSINFLHSQSPPVLHRDIKSHNFLIDQHMVLKVCDFGLAKLKQESSHQSTIAGPGFAGTIAYSAPEQLPSGNRKPRYNEKCDVYSVGIVLWELATGETPYEGCTPAEILAMVTSGGRMEIPQRIPTYFKDWITQCWTDNPNDRPTCQQLLQQIEQHQSREPITTVCNDMKAEESIRPVCNDMKAEDDYFHIVTTVTAVDSPSAATPSPGPVSLLSPQSTSVSQFNRNEQCAMQTVSSQPSIADIISIMKLHRQSCIVQQKACGLLLELLLQSTANKVSVTNAGGIATIISAMRNHAMDVVIQRRACRVLLNLASNNDANRVSIANAGGIVSIISAMRNHHQDVIVQQGACGALANLASNNGTNRVSIANGGGIVRIITAMNDHVNDLVVQQNACCALLNLAFSGANQAFIGNAGGIVSIITAMRNHVNDLLVQQNACWVLLNLAINHANRVSIANAGGIVRIIVAMKNHDRDVIIQQKACGALANIASINDSNRVSIDPDGIVSILNAMNNYPNDVVVQQNACCVLLNLASNNDANRVSIANAGGIVSIISAMRNHHQDVIVQQRACGALANLASNNITNRVSIANGGVLGLIRTAMNKHRAKAEVRNAAKLALEVLGIGIWKRFWW